MSDSWPSRRLESAAVEFVGSGLRNKRYGDTYHSADGAADECRHVFINGNDLSHRFAACEDQFVVAELGFGTGLNFCLAWEAWRSCSRPGVKLHYLAWESTPLTQQDMCRFLEGRVPEKLAQRLCANLPLRWPGWHQVHLADDVCLTLAYEDVSGVTDADFAADAWFLDGFAPQRNQAMWSEDVLAHVHRLTKQGGTLSTYTVAGNVLRGLASAGFDVQRHKGFGSKREMTRAWRPGKAKRQCCRPSHVGVVGAGVAAASLIYSLGRRKVRTTQIAPADVLGASANPAVLLNPRPTVGNTSLGALANASFAYTERLLRAMRLAQSQGAVLLAHSQRERHRQESLAQQSWPSDMHNHLNAAEVAERVGLDAGHSGLWFPRSLKVNGPDMVTVLTGKEAERVDAKVTEVRTNHAGERWHAVLGKEALEFDWLVLACGMDIARLAPDSLNLRAQPGGLCEVAASKSSVKLRVPLLFGGCLMPAQAGRHLFTASAKLPASLAILLNSSDGKEVWSGQRCKTIDHLPVAGSLAEGLAVLGGLGSRGFTQAPLLAEFLVAQACGEPLPLPRRLVNCVAPGAKRKQWG